MSEGSLVDCASVSISDEVSDELDLEVPADSLLDGSLVVDDASLSALFVSSENGGSGELSIKLASDELLESSSIVEAFLSLSLKPLDHLSGLEVEQLEGSGLTSADNLLSVSSQVDSTGSSILLDLLDNLGLESPAHLLGEGVHLPECASLTLLDGSLNDLGSLHRSGP